MAKKGLLGLLIGEPKPGEEHGDDEHDEEAEGGDSKARAERAFARLREALEDGDDDKAGARALHDAIKACEAADYGEEEAEGEGDEHGDKGDEGGE
jgi:hypothetical protein